MINNYKWTPERLKCMGADFLSSVIVNMGSPILKPNVRFGECGTGKSPNYEVSKNLGDLWGGVKTEIFHSRGHKPYTNQKEYLGEHLSKSFSLDDMNILLKSTTSA
ncbi:hypothetical protein [Psychromonas ingrahamii]|uniref:hypothetical protein n=1 Tax=Psychromonas ingrahamii TaxID=357794 RepID=UPI00059F3D6A|nr:hypothetical protein [Psychromonas ingrahamii]